jgi:CheY-like chemotaxis protein
LTLGQAADAAGAQARAQGDPPDVVLLDAGLENSGALELVNALRADPSTQRTKIVLLTNPHARLDMGVIAPLVDDYLAYPFPPMQLFSTLREHIPEAFGESRWH